MTLKSSLLIVSLFLISCSEQQARKPITQQVIQDSLTSASSILKKINSIEELKIINYIKKDTFHDYIRSPNGFFGIDI